MMGAPIRQLDYLLLAVIVVWCVISSTRNLRAMMPPSVLLMLKASVPVPPFVVAVAGKSV